MVGGSEDEALMSLQRAAPQEARSCTDRCRFLRRVFDNESSDELTDAGVCVCVCRAAEGRFRVVRMCQNDEVFHFAFRNQRRAAAPRSRPSYTSRNLSLSYLSVCKTSV